MFTILSNSGFKFASLSFPSLPDHPYLPSPPKNSTDCTFLLLLKKLDSSEGCRTIGAVEQ